MAANSPRHLTRRTFLCATAGIALSGRSATDTTLVSVSRRTQPDLFVINMLGGLRNPNRPPPEGPAEGSGLGDQPGPDARAISDALASGMAAANTTVGYVAGPRNPFESSVADVSRWNRIIREHPDSLLKVWSASDIERAARQGKVGIIQGFQNAAMMGDNAERVGVFAGLGVKIIQLTYNVANQLGHGSMVPENGGLTDFGRDVVAELNATNTLVDLSHSGEQTCLDGIDASTAPVAITHTGCRAVTDLPAEQDRPGTSPGRRDRRNRRDLLHAVPGGRRHGRGGGCGSAHRARLVEVCGEEHVGIGTDGGTTAVDDMEAAYEAARRDVEARRAAGIGAAGERPGVVPFIPDLQGPDQFRKLADMLVARGHSTERVERTLGLNALRVMREVWGA